MQTDKHWSKVIYKEDKNNPLSLTKVKQGYFYDEGDFVKVVGDFKTTLIRKENISAIEFIDKEEGK